MSEHAAKKKGLNMGLVRRILGYTQKYKALFFGAVFITLLLAALAIVRPLLISVALNDFVIGERNLTGLNQICFLILGFLLVEALCVALNLACASLFTA